MDTLKTTYLEGMQTSEVYEGEKQIDLDHIIGQQNNIEIIKTMVLAAKIRNEVPDHILLSGPTSSGKMTIAEAIANTNNSKLRKCTAKDITSTKDLSSILGVLEPGDIIVVTEFEQLKPKVAEVIKRAMSDFELEVMIGSENGRGRLVRLDLPPFTLIALTTDVTRVDPSLLDSFEFVGIMAPYSDEDIIQFINLQENELDLVIEPAAVALLASRSDGKLNTAMKLLRRVRDFAQVAGLKHIDATFTESILKRIV